MEVPIMVDFINSPKFKFYSANEFKPGESDGISPSL